MRPALVLVVTWLVAVVVAGAVGFFAISLVDPVPRDPIGLAPHGLAGPPLDVADGPPVQRAFTYDSGTLSVECRGDVARMLGSAPSAGWVVVDPEAGPDEDVDVTFQQGAAVFEVEVYCNDGLPQPVIGG